MAAKKKTPPAKSRKTFTGDLSQYKDKFLRCRGRRNHPWKFKTDFNIVTKGDRIIEFTQTLHCAVCTTNREDTYEVTPEGRFRRKGHPRYEYADGYQLHRGSRVSLEEARDELLTRELSGALDTELMNRLMSMRPDVQSQVTGVRHLKAV